MTPAQKAALLQAIQFFGGILRGRRPGGRVGIPTPVLPPGLIRGRQPDGRIGVPGPILPPGLHRGRPEVRDVKGVIGIPTVPYPGLTRGRVADVGKFLPSPIERPGGPLPPSIGGGRGHVLTKNPGGGSAPLPRNPGDGEYHAF